MPAIGLWNGGICKSWRMVWKIIEDCIFEQSERTGLESLKSKLTDEKQRAGTDPAHKRDRFGPFCVCAQLEGSLSCSRRRK